MLTPLFERFVEKAPVSVMVRGLLERCMGALALNKIYEHASDRQYTNTLLFSSVFELMNLVVCKIQPSIHAAYQDRQQEIGTSITSVYNKLNGIETSTSRALVVETAQELAQFVRQLKGSCPAWLPGYKVKVLDGNCIEASEHRLEVLRHTSSGALPGKSLVIYEPELEMATEVFPCEDGHAQERSLLGEVSETVEARDVFIMDRNFCVQDFLDRLAQRKAFYICRQHKGLPWKAESKERLVGRVEGTRIYEQWVRISNRQGDTRKVRRIRIVLKKATRDGEKELTILTNLSKTVAPAKLIAELYRKRWCIETAFQELEAHLHSEINTLGYPKAALFGFCVALMAYNALAVVKAALRSVHGVDKVSNEISGYYLAGHLARTHEGMMIAIPDQEWMIFSVMSDEAFTQTLRSLAEKVSLLKFKKHKRGVKKPLTKRTQNLNQPHVSTARLIAP